MQCGAKTKTGSPCKSPAMPNGRCRRHGGATPSGIAHPNTIHGRYSKHLPTRLAERYITAQGDPDLLNLQHEISLVDTRLSELLERIDVDGAGALWGSLAWLQGDMMQALTDDDLEEVKSCVKRFGEIISQAAADKQAWDAIYPVIEQRRKLVESEQKRRVAMQDIVTSEQMGLVIGQLTAAVKRHVSDPDVLAAIAREFATTLS